MVYNQYGAQNQHQSQGQQHYSTRDATPVPGISIKPPLVQPAPGQHIVHYEVYSPKVGCCECEGMTSTGMVAVILLLIFLPPFCFIPCLMNECFEQQQRPVYGYPPGSSTQQYQQSGQQGQQYGQQNQHSGSQGQQYQPSAQKGQQYPETSIPVAEPVQGQPVSYPKATQPPTQPPV